MHGVYFWVWLKIHPSVEEIKYIYCAKSNVWIVELFFFWSYYMHKNVWAYINPFVILPHKMMSNTDHMYVCILDKCFITWNKWMLCEKSSRVKCRLGIIMCHYDYIEPYFKYLKNKFYQSFASWRLYLSNLLRKLGQKLF